jgi:PAS domain S-box-containing protein
MFMINPILMNHVPLRWLRLLHICYLVADVLLIGSIMALHLTHANQHTIHHWGATTLVAAVAAVHLAYGVFVYPWLQRSKAWLATIISQILFDLIFAAVIQASGYNNFFYRGGWIVTVGASTTIGFNMGMGETAIDAFLNILTLLGIAKPSTNGPFTEWFLTVGVALAWLGGWYIFRHHYEADTNDPQNEQLNRYLAQSQMQSNLIFQSIADGVIVFDVTGKISSMNPAAAKLTGWSIKDAVGLDIRLVMKLAQANGQPLGTNQDLFLLALQSEQHVNQTLSLTSSQDEHTVISLNISPIVVTPRDTAGAVAVFRDITQEHKEEQQRADFISTASHEMRTPVAAIEGYLSLALNNKVSRVDSKAREYLEKAHASTENLGKLFQDLLTSAKAEDGRLGNHPVVIEVGSFLQQLVEELRFAAQKKHLAVEFVVGSNSVIDASSTDGQVMPSEHVVKPLFYIHADPDRLREVITNLFDNAVKYTEQGKISLGLTGDNNVVQLYIRDSGAGIPEEDIPHLFQKFYRVDNTATRTIGGTGLGLFICRKIVELYHGQIWVESKFGHGSTFYINVPRLSAQKAVQLQASEAATNPIVKPVNITSLTTS